MPGLDYSLFLPMIVLALGIAVLAFIMGGARFVAARTGKVSGKDIVASNWPGRLGILSDSYNNQFQMPQIFYMVCIALTLLGAVTPLAIRLAWAFVILRLIHAIWHNTKNVIIIRFLIFVAGGIVLTWMLGLALLATLGRLG